MDRDREPGQDGVRVMSAATTAVMTTTLCAELHARSERVDECEWHPGDPDTLPAWFVILSVVLALALICRALYALLS